MNMRPFEPEEYAARILRVRKAMAERELDACIVTSPENVYYLTGLNHQGYFAYTALIVPLEDEPVLISRAMEWAIMRDMVPELEHATFADQTDESAEFPASVETTRRVLHGLGLHGRRLAFEQCSAFLPYATVDALMRAMPEAQWLDVGELINECRVVQSPAEIELTRKAAAISDAMVLAGAAVAGPGVAEHEVTAAIYQAMLTRGGTYPAFVPLVRSTTTLEHEHGTWGSARLADEDVLFLEMSGCHWRYHAPVGRLVSIGKLDSATEATHAIALDAHQAAAEALRPGTTAGTVYDRWKATIDAGGLTHYHRHHCGYVVGIGFPPSWSGSGVPRGLRAGSDMPIREGMVFHLMTWLLRTGQGDAFLSDTAVVTDRGCELLTRAPPGVTVR